MIFRALLVTFLMSPAIAALSCGAHYAGSCADCSQGNGAFWCNGDCQWIDSQCVEKSIRGLHLNTTPMSRSSHIFVFLFLVLR